MITQDYSVWLTPERLQVEEQQWAEVAIYRLYASKLLTVSAEERCRSVIELGCGTGWVPTCLPETLQYVGVDGNEDCLTIARTKTTRMFLNADIRGLGYPRQDLVCCFAVMKHFALCEWAAVLAKVLSHGRIGVFSMNVGTRDVDDFSGGFAHTWISPGTLFESVQKAGHQVVSLEAMHTLETMVVTCIRS